MYLPSKHQSGGDLGGMRYPNRVLSNYLLLCTCNYPFYNACESRIKYVDNTSVFAYIPRCSPSYLPFIVANINTYSSMRNRRLNEKKCKDMVINFLKYQPTVITLIQLNGIVIDRVSSYKLLGVIISNDLSWNEHKKATKRLFVLRTLKRVGLGTNDLVLVYCSIVRSIVEYASPVWAAVPLYLDAS